MVMMAKPNRRANFRLLTDWANTPDSSVFLKKHPELPRSLSQDDVTEIRWALQRAWESEDLRAREWHLFIARWFYVRATETRANLSAFFGQRLVYHLIPGVPTHDRFHQAIADLQGVLHRMVNCRWDQIARALATEQLQRSKGLKDVTGIPWCPEPLYIRRDTKRKQPYCSQRCHGNFLSLARKRNGLRISELILK
jgi:hypothetical protein